MFNMGKRANKRRRQQSKTSPSNSSKKQCIITDFVVRPKDWNKSGNSSSGILHLNTEVKSDSDMSDANSVSDKLSDTETMAKAEKSHDELKEMMTRIMEKQDQLHSQMSGVEGRLTNIDLILVKHDKSLDALHADVNGLKNKVQSIDAQISDVNPAIQSNSVQRQIEELSDHLNSLERKSRERNLRLIGYPEEPNENCLELVKYIIHDVLRVDGYVEVAHRTGRAVVRDGHRMPRHIIFRMETVSQKLDILYYQRQALFRESHFITDDLTQKDLQTKRRLKPVIDQARQEGKRWKFKNGKLIIEGQVYQEGQEVGHMHRRNQAPPPPQQTFAAVTSGVQMASQRMPIPPTAAMRMPQPALVQPRAPVVSNTGQHPASQVQHITHRANQLDRDWPHLTPPPLAPQVLHMSHDNQNQQMPFQQSTPTYMTGPRQTLPNAMHYSPVQPVSFTAGPRSF